MPKADPSVSSYTRAPVAKIGNAPRDLETSKYLNMQSNRPGPSSYLPTKIQLAPCVFDINRSNASSKGFKLSNRTNAGDIKSLGRNREKITKTS